MEYNILYVDDEEINVAIFEATFVHKYRIFTANSGYQALQLLEGQDIHLVITDYKMPEMSGIELLKHITRTHPEVEKIILTAYTDMEVIMEAFNLCRIFQYVHKPWQETELRIIIENALSSYQLKYDNRKLIQQLQKTNEILESKVRDRTLEIQRKNMEILEKEKAIYETQHSLAQAQMKNMMLEKEKLANDLVYKSQELTGYTLHLAQKNAVLEALRAQIEELKGTTPDQEIVRKLNRMVRQIDFNLNRYEEWERFRMAFESVHKDFFTVMKKRYKGLTSKDLRLCALLKINFSTNEIASILGISARSVNVARYRLRKKLQVSHDEKLLDLLMAV